MAPPAEPREPDPSGDPDGSPEPSSVNGRAGRNLPLAFASGVTLAAVFIAANWWSPWALLALILALVLVAVAELGSAFTEIGIRPWTSVAAGSAPVFLVGALVLGPAGQVVGLALLLAGAVVAGLVAGPGPAPTSTPGSGGAAARGGAARGTRDAEGDEGPSRWAGEARGGGQAVAAVATTVLMGLWVPFLGSFSMLLADRDHGEWLVLSVVALAVVYDIGAYAVGVLIGRHRLAPKVSPGKSWEGAAGGLAVTLLLSGLVVAQVATLDVGLALALGAVVAVAATVGDLFESLVKRDVGIKDLGRVMPGHGGIMDRVDAILFALPAAHIVLVLAGV